MEHTEIIDMLAHKLVKKAHALGVNIAIAVEVRPGVQRIYHTGDAEFVSDASDLLALESEELISDREAIADEILEGIEDDF